MNTLLAQADAVESGAYTAAHIAENQGSCTYLNGVETSTAVTGTADGHTWDIYNIPNSSTTRTNQATSCSNFNVTSTLKVSQPDGTFEDYSGINPAGSQYFSDDAYGALSAVWEARLELPQNITSQYFSGGHYTACASAPTVTNYGPCAGMDGDHPIDVEYVSGNIPLQSPLLPTYFTIGNITGSAYMPDPIGSQVLP